jgi:hypothetical protein
MIPAILAAPVVEGVIGGVVDQVSNFFSPSSSSEPTPASTTSFNPYLNNATTTAASQPSVESSPTGTMRADDWSQMGNTDLQTWMKSLEGKHVNATDESGRTISGTVSGMQQLGHTLALNIGGHLVSLSQLKQVTWSPSVA